MRFGYGVRAEMEDAGRQHRAGVAVGDPFDQMIEIADTAAGDDRDADRIGNGAGEREVIACLGAVAVHAGDEQFARAEIGETDRML